MSAFAIIESKDTQKFMIECLANCLPNQLTEMNVSGTQTPLMVAIERKLRDVVEFFTTQDIIQQTVDWNQLLDYAVKTESSKRIKTLLRQQIRNPIPSCSTDTRAQVPVPQALNETTIGQLMDKLIEIEKKIDLLLPKTKK